MIERRPVPPDGALEPPRARRARSFAYDDEVSRRLRNGGIPLKEIARKAARAAESSVILLTLQHTHWNRVRAAQLLNISYRSLLYKITEFGLHPAARTPPRQPARLGTGQDRVSPEIP